MNGLSLFTLLFKETNIKPGSEDIPGRLEVVCEDTDDGDWKSYVKTQRTVIGSRM
jgi:hypothetical protein